ncbi:hypothetical protein SAMN04488103_11021 [Gemmobacter aquatilis]|uniref:Argininosuccinate lyase n=1 Tax=Gemmobacter aquatilis TaxID=933059 RepID=A0A1H8KXF5_9RHOB|nr:argininosuccinate lyase [Gemmobacter aquatilis]SEN97577.1 hypothetical protein SAMN04488103_11021 [Gemmobacter aquatilis]
MTRLIPPLLMLSLLAACGAAGAPVAPAAAPAPGVALHGQVKVGVGYSE